MSLLSRSRLGVANFWTKLTNWEYWPFEVIYAPIFFYWLWLSLRARSFFFFSASNPGIENGGMLGESKFDIHKLIPSSFVPTTILMDSESTSEDVIRQMEKYHLDFPIILKPDIGERGWRVEKISDTNELKEYIDSNKIDFLLQEYVDLPLELGIFYYRYPNSTSGAITSVVKKKMLSVVGDGTLTVEQLMLSQPRARLQLGTFREHLPELLDQVPDQGTHLELMPIGNHCRGTTFLDFNEIITPDLVVEFDKLSQQIPGFYFGRFDIRCRSVEALQNGDFIILELNGAGSEPGHIYQPGARLLDAYKSLFFHWKTLFGISRMNNRNGNPYPSTREGLEAIRRLRAYSRVKATMV